MELIHVEVEILIKYIHLECHYSCLDCVGGNTSNDCTSCSSEENRTLDGESCPCDSGYFDDDVAVCVGINLYKLFGLIIIIPKHAITPA